MAAEQVEAARVLEALRSVKDPELNVDIVTLGMIEGLKVSDGTVSFTVTLNATAVPTLETLSLYCSVPLSGIGIPPVPACATPCAPTRRVSMPASTG